MSTKISKDDLRSPDQMTKTLREGFVWTTGHSNLVLGAIGLFIVIGVVVGITSHLSEKKEVTQQEKYFLLEKDYTKVKAGFDQAARSELMAAMTKDKKAPAVDPTKKASGDIEKDYGTVVKGFAALIDEAPKSKAAQMAALNLSEIYLNYQKNDEAASVLAKVEPGLNKKDVLSSLVWLQSGTALSSKGDCKGAVEKWQALASTKALAFAHDEAKVRMGLCYESMNDLTKAEQLYTEVSMKSEDSVTDVAANREAQKYLRLLKAKKNL